MLENLSKCIHICLAEVFLRDNDLNIVKSGFIHGAVVITLDNYDDQNGAIKSNNSTSQILSRVLAKDTSALSEAKGFSATLVERENVVLDCPNATIILSQYSYKRQDVC